MRRFPRTDRVLLPFLVVVAACAILTIVGLSPRTSGSPEVKFADRSSGGLSIVPASCPSNPHTAGECDVPAIGGCTISPSSHSITPGQSVTLNWTVPQPSTSIFTSSSFSGTISPGVGSVSGWSGSVTVHPVVSTTYLLSGTMTAQLPWLGTARTGSASCMGSVVISGSPGSCSPSNICTNGVVTNSCTGAVVQACSAVCFSGACLSKCPTGMIQSGQTCSCPAGYHIQGNSCVAGSGCSPTYFCSEGSLYYRDASCADALTESCTYGCSGGQCNAPPEPGVELWEVRPTLLRSGDRVTVSWSVTNVRSCHVEGDNGDAWNGVSGSQVSSPITHRTTFTLTCLGLDSQPTSQNTVVNIIPIFEEH